MSMFSFQAIHNSRSKLGAQPMVVYRLCQCSLFKQFTTADDHREHSRWLFIDYVNVLFSSNSQRWHPSFQRENVVYRLCQCSLFKQFTTYLTRATHQGWLFIDYVNVLFSSNSQHRVAGIEVRSCCLSIMSMFSFQAIHNAQTSRRDKHKVVYRLCQCSLFKQFTTKR